MEPLDYSSDTESSGSKFLLDCKSITNETPTTEGWLDNITALKTITTMKAVGMSRKKILEGLFNKRTNVVIKISDNSEEIEKEWYTFQKAKEFQLPGILEYYCYFTCADSVLNFTPTNQNKANICNGPGNSLKVLVMEYIKNPSFKRFQWINIDIFRSCFKQVILTLLEGFLLCHFIHGDMHLDNALLKNTTRSTINYPTVGIELPLHGYAVKLMDLEDGSVNEGRPILDFFKDIQKFVGKMAGDLISFINITQIQAIYIVVEKWVSNETPTDPRIVMQLLDMIDHIELIPHSGGKHEKPTPKLKKRRSDISKSRLSSL